MSDLNSQHNRVVWFDLPVADLDRAMAFYTGVLAIKVSKETFENWSFAVLEHEQGNGGCLVPGANEISATHGILVYMNVEGRIKEAMARVEPLGGKVVQPVHEIGPHGFRAVVLDSEGNRIALHSSVNA